MTLLLSWIRGQTKESLVKTKLIASSYWSLCLVSCRETSRTWWNSATLGCFSDPSLSARNLLKLWQDKEGDWTTLFQLFCLSHSRVTKQVRSKQCYSPRKKKKTFVCSSFILKKPSAPVCRCQGTHANLFSSSHCLQLPVMASSCSSSVVFFSKAARAEWLLALIPLASLSNCWQSPWKIKADWKRLLQGGCQDGWGRIQSLKYVIPHCHKVRQ